VVAATDYAGAGGTGAGEKYMVIADQGRDVINSVRAALALPTGAGNVYATYGESQGGLISLAAGVLGPAYAPELSLAGIGGVASASDIGSLMQSKWDRPLASWLLGPHLVRAWTRQYPNLDASAILTPAAREHYAEIADDSCLFDVLGALINPQMGLFLSGDPTTNPDWRAAFMANKAPDPPPGAPVFVGHGLADPLIDPSFSAGLVQRYCSAGASVRTVWMPGVEHIGSSTNAAPAYMDWLATLLSGGGAPNDCGAPLPVTPAPGLN
jgi:pimeloyl-ACP methyl ester carboxylesterase